MVAGAPIDHLFIGGFVPGLLMILLVAAYGVAVGVKVKAPRQPFEPREAVRALWGAKWDLGLPTLVVVSVASGYATIVESSALAAAYSIIVETGDLPRGQPVARPAAACSPTPPRWSARWCCCSAPRSA